MNILIVDDDDMSRYSLREIIRSLGHEAIECNDGRAAQEALSRHEIGALVTDIIMPDMDGIELLTWTRDTNPALPVIVISGGGRTRNLDFLDIARKFGATAVLAKPFTAADLSIALTSADPTGRAPADGATVGEAR